MSTQIRPVTLGAVPESIDGLLSIFQDLYVKLGIVALDIAGFRTFRDYSYLGTAEEVLDELQIIVRLSQSGLIARQFAEEVRSC